VAKVNENKIEFIMKVTNRPRGIMAILFRTRLLDQKSFWEAIKKSRTTFNTSDRLPFNKGDTVKITIEKVEENSG
jgi:hypothetical protein